MGNIIQDLLLAYLVFALVAPVFVIGCLNVILSQMKSSDEKSTIPCPPEVDLNGKTYFSVLVLIVILGVL